MCLRLNIYANNYGFRQVVLNSPISAAVNSGGLIPPMVAAGAPQLSTPRFRYSCDHVSVEMWGYSASLSDAGAQSRVAGL